ncbi:PilZ domain-containing protein [Nitrospira sp. M1]
MSDTPGRRACTRVDVTHVVELQAGETRPIQGVLYDVSLNGLYVQCADRLPLHADCHVTLSLDGGDGELCIHATGRVVRIDDAGLAIQFTNILGEDSLAHLRNLVLLNSHECLPQVEQEFREHLGVKAKE